MKKLIAVSILSLSLFACKKETTTNNVMPVNQNYALYYNVSTDHTTFRAHFNHTNNQTILPDGYSITVNDSGMSCLQNPSPPSTPSTGPSYYYTRTDSGNSAAHFKLRRADGTILNNIIPAGTVPLINFDSTFSAISKSDTLFVPFTTDSLNQGESIMVTIFQDIQHFTFQMVPVQSGDTLAVILPTQMNNLISGPAKLTITRQSNVIQLLNADGAGTGQMRSTTYAEQQVIIQL